MVMKLRISPRAKRDLRKIYAWYKKEANGKVAKSITDDITSAVEILRTHPSLGHIEPELDSFPQSFRTYVLVPEMLMYIINTQTDWLCEPQVDYGESTGILK